MPEISADTCKVIINLSTASILILATVIVAAIGYALIWKLIKSKESEHLEYFLMEFNANGTVGKPSIARLQMLIWNFVIALSFLYVVATESCLNDLDKLLSPSVLTLLGISNGTYFLSKKYGGSGNILQNNNNPDLDTNLDPMHIASGGGAFKK